MEEKDNHIEIEKFKENFEYWCRCCVKIKDKITGQNIPFVLNQPQRKLLAVMEAQRKSGKPIRVILLKSRQWGGSTLVQIYIAWFQLVKFYGRNSVIIGHKKNSSFAIKNMFRNVLKNYPAEYLEDDEEKIELVNVKDATDIQEITTRDCTITITSSYSPDAVRGQSLSFAHLSEVAFWKSSRNIDPSDIIRSVTGTVPLVPNTIIVLESTANGTNSFFYNEWNRAVNGKSIFEPVFIGWNEIEMYSKKLDDEFSQIILNDYEKALKDNGCTNEQIYWYHEKMKEFAEHDLMKAEFPSNAEEAFISSTHFVFSTGEQIQVVENVSTPIESDGDLKIWSNPKADSKKLRYEYIGMVTPGHNVGEEQISVFSIWYFHKENNCIELVAQLDGKIQLNIFAQKVLSLCKKYHNALLIIANNNINSSEINRSQGKFILNEDIEKYKNLYRSGKNNFLNVDRDLYSLMFYELIVNEKNQLFIDHDEQACKAIASMTIHNNQKFYIADDNDFNFVLNRAEVLYTFRNLSMKNTSFFTNEVKQALFR